MVDINAAYQDAKFLSDDDLKRELSQPSGMIPGYIAMAEMQDRTALRAGSGGKPVGSMKDEMLQGYVPQQQPMAPSRQYSKGGIIAALNPFYAQVQGMRNPDVVGGLMQEQINNASGGLPQLQSAQAPGAPTAPPEINSLQPLAAGTPQEVKHFASGGLASLYRR